MQLKVNKSSSASLPSSCLLQSTSQLPPLTSSHLLCLFLLPSTVSFLSKPLESPIIHLLVLLLLVCSNLQPLLTPASFPARYPLSFTPHLVLATVQQLVSPFLVPLAHPPGEEPTESVWKNQKAAWQAIEVSCLSDWRRPTKFFKFFLEEEATANDIWLHAKASS